MCEKFFNLCCHWIHYLTAQLTLSLGIITREYHYFKSVKTWAQAQKYCRDNFVDLATIATAEDWAIVRAMMQNNGGNAWIGLFDDYISWRWSINNTFLYKDGNIPLATWLSLNVDNYGSVEHCGQLHLGSLYDCPCGEVKRSVCYDGECALFHNICHCYKCISLH